MSLADATVFVTEYEDGSADFTIAIDDENYRFSTVVNDGHATLSYEETLSYRGQIRVSEPRSEVFRLLIQSAEMTDYLDSNNLQSVNVKR